MYLQLILLHFYGIVHINLCGILMIHRFNNLMMETEILSSFPDAAMTDFSTLQNRSVQFISLFHSLNISFCWTAPSTKNIRNLSKIFESTRRLHYFFLGSKRLFWKVFPGLNLKEFQFIHQQLEFVLSHPA